MSVNTARMRRSLRRSRQAYRQTRMDAMTPEHRAEHEAANANGCFCPECGDDDAKAYSEFIARLARRQS